MKSYAHSHAKHKCDLLTGIGFISPSVHAFKVKAKQVIKIKYSLFKYDIRLRDGPQKLLRELLSVAFKVLNEKHSHDRQDKKPAPCDNPQVLSKEHVFTWIVVMPTRGETATCRGAMKMRQRHMRRPVTAKGPLKVSGNEALK